MYYMKIRIKEMPRYLSWKGLLFEPTAKPILLYTRFGIHTLFLRFPIDVVILSGDNKIVALKKDLKPFRLFFWNPTYEKVVELPSGTIEKCNLHVGQTYTLNV